MLGWMKAFQAQTILLFVFLDEELLLLVRGQVPLGQLVGTQPPLHRALAFLTNLGLSFGGARIRLEVLGGLERQFQIVLSTHSPSVGSLVSKGVPFMGPRTPDRTKGRGTVNGLLVASLDGLLHQNGRVLLGGGRQALVQGRREQGSLFSRSLHRLWVM